MEQTKQYALTPTQVELLGVIMKNFNLSDWLNEPDQSWIEEDGSKTYYEDQFNEMDFMFNSTEEVEDNKTIVDMLDEIEEFLQSIDETDGQRQYYAEALILHSTLWSVSSLYEGLGMLDTCKTKWCNLVEENM
jgi:hypothetical protein